MTRSIVLAGDSIFDNAAYVIGEPCVTEQLRQLLAEADELAMVAVDGHCVGDVAGQLKRLPESATHIFVSAGGNDALGHYEMLMNGLLSSFELLQRLTSIQAGFRRDYRSMLEAVTALNLPTAVCTIYDAVPGVEPEAITALSIFNDVIVSEAAAAGLPIVDLRRICTEHEDYSDISPVEPSSCGGAKIAAVLKQVVEEHDFSKRRCAIYP
jgi:hypothetical protein